MRIIPVLASVSSLAVLSFLGACADGNDIIGGAGGLGPSGGSTTATTVAQTTSQATTAATKAASTTAVSSSATSNATTTSSGSTTATSSSTGGPMCGDVGPEPNDTFESAHDLGTIGDGDGDGGSVSANLGQGGDDVDWYKYRGEDNVGSVVDPTRMLIGAGIRICKYIRCGDANDPNDEDEDFECPGGTTTDVDAAGDPGCCWTSGLDVQIDLVCGSSSLNSDDATIFIRIDRPNGMGCESYQLDYHY